MTLLQAPRTGAHVSDPIEPQRARPAGARTSVAVARAEEWLVDHDEPLPDRRFGLSRPIADSPSGESERWEDALATSLMDAFRRTRSRRAFDRLTELVTPSLNRRARSRVRFSNRRLDPAEVVQDALVNVYRYPERFDASRCGAFRAWASIIVDNAVRRQLRAQRSGIDLQLRPSEMLSSHPDAVGRQPGQRAEAAEACRNALSAYRVVLACYLDAYLSLSDRERFVLQMVEVHGVRYADLAPQVGVRPEALKMVVFRARRRIFDRMNHLLDGAENGSLAAA